MEFLRKLFSIDNRGNKLSKYVSMYPFSNEKKIYNKITDIKYINFVNWVSLKD